MPGSKCDYVSILGDEYVKEINDLLKKHSGTSGGVKDIEDLLEFVPSGIRRDIFLTNLGYHIGENKNVLKQIDASCSKINQIEGSKEKVGSKCVPLFVYSLGDKMSNITKAIRYRNRELLDEMLKHKRCYFFVTETGYNRYIKDADAYGTPAEYDRAGKSLQWVMPTKSAMGILKMIVRAPDSDARREIYAEKIGLKLEWLEDEKAFYLIHLGIARLKKENKALDKVFLPSKNVPGASDFWVPGGFTSGGVPEIIVDSCPRRKPFWSSEGSTTFDVFLCVYCVGDFVGICSGG